MSGSPEGYHFSEETLLSACRDRITHHLCTDRILELGLDEAIAPFSRISLFLKYWLTLHLGHFIE